MSPPIFSELFLRNKPAHFLKFYQILLILSGDISLNPGPCQTQLNDDKTWDPLKTKGLHLCHLNVNSLLSKIDEIRDFSKFSSQKLNPLRLEYSIDLRIPMIF